MSLKPVCPKPDALENYTFKKFKGAFFKAIRKLAKKHNSPENAAPFYLHTKQDYIDRPESFFMVFGKMNAWKRYAKHFATKLLALRGACYVTYDPEAKNLLLHIMPVAGRLKSKENAVARAMKQVVPPTRCSVVFDKGDFDESMLDNLESLTESMEDTPDDARADAMEDAVAGLKEQALEAAKRAATPKEAKQILLIARDVENLENLLEQLATITDLREMKSLDDKIRSIFSKYGAA